MSGSPEDWLRHAASDLALARVPRPAEVLTEALCFHAQQAAEKALKAVLIAADISPPRTHNLRTVLDTMPSSANPPQAVQSAVKLSVYAVMTRYPADLEPVTQEEYEEAVRLAETVVAWAEEMISSSTLS